MTADEFKAALPAFIGLDNPTIDAAIAASATYISADDWGTFYSDGVKWWVADYLASMPATVAAGADGGDTTMEMVGSVEFQRDARVILSEMTNPALRTWFGQKFREVQMLAFGGTTLAT